MTRRITETAHVTFQTAVMERSRVMIRRAIGLLPSGTAIVLYVLVTCAHVSAANSTEATRAPHDASPIAPVVIDDLSTLPGEVIESPPPPPVEVIEYYATDAVGSIRVVFAPNGNVVGRSDYLPFGEEVSADNMPTERFTGQERDPEAGLDNFGARYYASRIGRFGRIDPAFGGALLDPQQWNRYAYARNNPLSFVDPTGMFAEYSEETVFVHGTYDPWNLTLPGGSFPGWASYIQFLECGARVCVEKPDHGDTGGTEPTADPEEDPGTDPTDPGGDPTPGPKPGPKGNGDTTGQPTCGDGSYHEKVLRRNISAMRTARFAADLVGPAGSLGGVMGAELGLIAGHAWLVRTGGVMDYKQYANPHTGPLERFGNMNFGATARAVGEYQWFILRGAGAYQYFVQTAKGEGVPWGGPPYGDQPEDAAPINAGIEYADKCK
jgi:RHS repeat-associated protein